MFKLKFEKPARKIINLGWHHGRYADLWSLVHISTGVLIGITTHIFSLPLKESAVIIIMLLALYEAFEMFTDTVEDVKNSITDIFIAFIAFILVHLYLGIHSVSITASIWLFSAVFAIIIILDYFGWKKYLRKKLKMDIDEAYVYIFVSKPKIIAVTSSVLIVAYTIFFI